MSRSSGYLSASSDAWAGAGSPDQARGELRSPCTGKAPGPHS